MSVRDVRIAQKSAQVKEIAACARSILCVRASKFPYVLRAQRTRGARARHRSSVNKNSWSWQILHTFPYLMIPFEESFHFDGCRIKIPVPFFPFVSPIFASRTTTRQFWVPICIAFSQLFILAEKIYWMILFLSTSRTTALCLILALQHTTAFHLRRDHRGVLNLPLVKKKSTFANVKIHSRMEKLM